MRIAGPKNKKDTFALLDEGATATLINQGLARHIGAKGPRTKITIGGVHPHEIVYANCEKVKIDIQSDFQRHEVTHAIAVPDLNLPCQSVSEDIVNLVNRCENISIRPYRNARVELMLGQDNWPLIMTREFREIGNTGLVVSRSLLGWAVHGYVARNSFNGAAGVYATDLKIESGPIGVDGEDVLLDELVRRFFVLDNLGINEANVAHGSLSHSRDILEKTTRQVGSAWETGLLWKEDAAPKCNGWVTAYKRLLALESRFERDPEYAELFRKEMARFIQNGYVAKAANHEDYRRVWYSPIFGVTNINKPGKVRIVLDAAAKTNGVSLNDQVEKGPDFLQPILGVIVRFRQFPIALKADIKDMFLRIKVREADRGAQRFLWRDGDKAKEPDEYEMTCLIFGARSSPCSAMYVKNQNASRYERSKPVAARSIIEDSYMDDFMTSVRTLLEARNLVRDVACINSEANFVMHGWASNDPRVFENLALIGTTTGDTKTTLCDQEEERVLGLYWDKTSDELGFNLGMSKIPIEIINARRRPTKREFLRIMMSVFDPLGALSPFMVNAKIILQEIWSSGIGWNTTLKDEQYKKWLVWLGSLPKISECRLPRCFQLKDTQIVSAQLHIFCDASLKAYAAVAYLRLEYTDGSIRVSFVMAKNRTAPMKPMTIPRLELNGALLASRIGKIIDRELRIHVHKRFFWTDSTTVMRWIHSEPRDKQVFVANRLGEIGELTRASEWSWVPTKANPADDATRWSTEPLRSSDRWFTGPGFLNEPKENWPKPKTLSAGEREEIDDLEARKIAICVAVVTEHDLSLARRLMGWEGLLLLARRVIKYVRIWRERTRDRTGGNITAEAENFWFRQIQRECFAAEIDALEKDKTIKKCSKIVGFKPFIDDKGILRAMGRATNIENPEFANNPVVLDAKHFATKLLIASYHRKYFHANADTVLNELRQRFYVVGLRRKLRSIISRCLTCRLRKRRPENPPMAALPAGRLAYKQRPFTHCGVDYFGPVQVKIGRRREKRWGVLFTCLSTRAIHLELAHTLNASSAVMALQRLAARRGSPSVVYSDNGTNFVKANKELKEAVANLNLEEQQSLAATKGIEWKFNPPAAPHMGGAWERLVRSVKIALDVVLREQAPSEEVLYTALTEIEHSINSRPLTHVSVDPRDHEALTPNHFLFGNSSGNVRLDRCEGMVFGARKQFRLAQQYADAFWKRWLREYLPTLLARKKWNAPTTPLSVGDVVLIADYQAPRNSWKKGTVKKVYPGADGIIRAAKVRTPTEDLKRPTCKLVRILGADEV